MKVSYTYENEKVTSIGHNGFTYDYAYDPFGNLRSVSVGGRELERTTLEAGTVLRTGSPMRQEKPFGMNTIQKNSLRHSI